MVFDEFRQWFCSQSFQKLVKCQKCDDLSFYISEECVWYGLVWSQQNHSSNKEELLEHINDHIIWPAGSYDTSNISAKWNIFLAQVATASGLGVFWKLLFIWRGSIYKLVWTNLAVYIVLYYTLSLTYRFGLDHTGRVMRWFLTLEWQNHQIFSRISLSRSVSTARSMLTWYQSHSCSASMSASWSLAGGPR